MSDNFSWGAYAAELEHKLDQVCEAHAKEKRKNRYLRQEIKALQKKLWGFMKTLQPKPLRFSEAREQAGGASLTASGGLLGLMLDKYGEEPWGKAQ